MFISEKLIFIELQKTGCTHIRKLLQNLVEGKTIGKHNAVTTKFFCEDICFVGSIRNPWEWYVSLWSYGCDKKGGVYERVTMPSKPLTDLLCLVKSFAFKLFYSELLRKPEMWMSLYKDPNDPNKFREWLRVIYDPKYRHDFGEGYGLSSIYKFSGLMTYRYLSLFCKNREVLFMKKINDYADMEVFEKSNNYLNYIIRNENLENDLITVLTERGINLTTQQKMWIYNAKKTNVSSRSHSLDYYYDKETAKLISNKERLIVEKFGYRCPILGFE